MEDKHQLWKLIYEHLATELTPQSMKTWFDDTQVVSFAPNALTLYTSSFKRPFIEERYMPALHRAMDSLYGGTFDIHITDDANAMEVIKMPLIDSQLDPDCLSEQYSFNNFIVGKSNEFAHAAAWATTNVTNTTNNPLFIYGDSGLGKTHLLYAMINKIKHDTPDSTLCAVTAENFTNEIISAIRTNKTKEFREKYRLVDMLFVDDIQFIGGKDYAMEEFFNTFNELYMNNNKLVFTSDRPPKEIPMLTDRLRSRFESGLVVDILPPDFETRVAIIQSKAITLGLPLPNDLSFYIAENITANIRQLEGAVKKIMAHHQLMNAPLDIETARRAIKDLLSENPGLNPTPEHIIKEVCRFYHLEEDELLSSSKRADIASARQIAIYLVKTLIDISNTKIGKIFNRDHSTITHSMSQVQNKKDNDDRTAREIDIILRNIRG
ncbi:MAG: chromosomal replication initiator protein DnaA [Oscillospiraceae bacterium]|nr:chromosomal replication initiator protein DnaA [Oscillospiraceae bacterium]